MNYDYTDFSLIDRIEIVVLKFLIKNFLYGFVTSLAILLLILVLLLVNDLK